MSRRPQAGVALITALLVVAIAVLAATALLTSSHLALRRTAALRDTEQGWMLARGVESWMLEIIKADGTDYDAIDDDNLWSLPVDYLPVDQGFIRGRIADQQGLFNLNNLHPDFSKDKQGADDIYRRQFERLLEQLAPEFKLPTPLPVLVPAIRDWMDGDQVVGFPGAEDYDYLRLDPPYRTADRTFESVSELRAVQGVTAEIYAALTTGCPLYPDGPRQPCISALPIGTAPGQLPAPTAINVNTASRQLLMSLSDNPDQSALDIFLRERPADPATNRSLFTSRNVYKGATPQVDTHYDVTTNFFQIRGEVVVGSSRVPLYSLIRRQPLGVIAHSAAEE